MNYQFLKPIFLIALVSVCIFGILFIVVKIIKNRNISMRHAALTVDELENHARRMALEHFVSQKRNILNWPIPRMNDNYSFILSVYKSLNEDIQQKRSVPAAAEWLLDNFYIIEEQVKSIRRDMKKKDYYQLPVLKSGPFKGYTRIYAIAMELISHIDGKIEETTLLKYLKAYQTHIVLLDREIWAIPIMIRLALIENIRNICKKIKDTKVQWNLADEIVERYWSDDFEETEKIIEIFKSNIDEVYKVNQSFVEHLFYRLRRSGKSYTKILRYIDESLYKYDTTTEIIAQKEHNAQAVSTVSMGNCIMSLKYVSNHNWVDLFESISLVEQILRKDPDGIYGQMNISSRNYYRAKIEKFAKIYSVSELHIAKEAIELAKNAFFSREQETLDKSISSKKSHVGYYLIGNGIKELENRQKGAMKNKTKAFRILSNNPAIIYMGSIIMSTFIFVAIAINYAMDNMEYNSVYMLIMVGLAVLIPASEIVVSFVNWIVCKLQKPSVFVRLELKDGIADNLRTMVAMPALLTDESRVVELLENMENHYISNSEKNLYFALIGAFKDHDGPSAFNDNAIIQKALDGIKKLNSKYSKGKEELFYFYHRERKFNERDNNWTGWERKRGALIEFNDMLLGNKHTSFSFYSNKKDIVKNIKYIITLDADTILPMGMAKKMIATMSHPLNTPVVDKEKGIVIAGHGLMQPRISFDMDSSNRSIFSRIYTGQHGLDPYASAVSDVYQDLFNEGIFTGKGIYDLEVFQSILKDTVPENSVLSHDLLEGSYVRAALVSNLELVDSYPSKYNSFATRLHRWIRGDWQLIPWLARKIYNRNNLLVKNPLSFISLWKISDNLRRSLVAPATLALMFLGFSILPGSSLVWISGAVITLALPFMLTIPDQLFSGELMSDRIKRYIPGFFGLKASLFQLLLSFILLPYQAYLVIDAIVTTLIRVFITKKNMLEWVTSADAEKVQDNSIKSYIYKMGITSMEGVAIVALAMYFKPEALSFSFVFLIIWSIAPFVAYYISKDDMHIEKKVSRSDEIELRKIARKTWRYFEEFVNYKNNYLAPDNFQQDPPRGIAYRTSPTNIGLGLMATITARDLGYIGIVEMIEEISKTITTIEKMEKCNGHLYNWYDTRTLEPLKPKYISTVDNGNYVCYLITLVQGLKDYFEKPLVDLTFVDGIKDTLMNGLLQSQVASLQVESFDEIIVDNKINLLKWDKALNTFLDENIVSNISNQVWKLKLERMINMFKKELKEFAPWITSIKNIPQDIFEKDNEEYIINVMQRLSSNISLANYTDSNETILLEIDTIKNKLKNIKTKKSETCILWLDVLKEDVLKSNEFLKKLSERFIGLIERIDILSWETKFSFLYDQGRQLFSIGYNVEEQKLTNSYYDLLASEARQTSYIAIARGEVPPKHWFALGRSLTVVDRFKGLVSWSGTMFEYLMPLLIMKSYRNTLLDETYSFVIKSQKKYGKQRGMPWGTSESGFNSMNMDLDYQYKAIGVPWLGLKRGLIEDAVAAPYATFLALLVHPFEAMENIKLLKSEGLEGAYGYYEAADYTPERLTYESKRVIIKSFMAHHQGMTLLALNNYLNNNLLQKRFHSNSYVKAARLLLQEKVPMNIVFTKENKEKIIPFKGLVYKDRVSLRKFNEPDINLPKAHILSNGNYSIMLTDKGTGYSKSKMVAISRWREDSILDNYGMLFYIKNVSTNSNWSATYAPLNVLPDNYEVCFTPDRATYRRRDGEIETVTEIVVTSGDYAEVRRLKLNNYGDSEAIMELTSYFEVVLTNQNNDLAHPAFSNLFIKTEFNHEYNALIANRRQRSESDKNLWVAHFVVVEGERVGDIQFETDRMQFIGRGHTVSNPIMIEKEKPLSNTVGPVLDPIFSLRLRVNIDPKKTARVSFITCMAESKELLFELIDKYSNIETCDAAFWLAMTRSQVETQYLNIKPEEMELYQEMISNLLFISPLRRNYEKYISKNSSGQSSLWRFGISGDKHIILVSIDKTDEVEILYKVLKAHEYWRIKDLQVDLVILSNDENSYTNPLFSLIKDVVNLSKAHDFMNKHGDVFILDSNNMKSEDINLLYAVAKIILKGNEGKMEEQLRTLQAQNAQNSKERIVDSTKQKLRIENQINNENIVPVINEKELQYFNGIGGFSKDGSEYSIKLEKDQMTPAPWVNVISNPGFGFMVSESGSGFTWCENSRENKITPWSNDSVTDTPGEVFYLGDESGKAWSITPLPIREDEAYIIKHGFGYTEFEHVSNGIRQKLTQFVPVIEPVKISIINLENLSSQTRNITLTYYLTPVLGVNTADTAMHIVTSKTSRGTLTISNPYNNEFGKKVCFIDTSIKDRSITGNRKEFFGMGKLDCPEGLKYENLSGDVGAGFDPCAAMQINIEIKPNETTEIVFLLGMGENLEKVNTILDKYNQNEKAKKALEEVKSFWKEKLQIIQVNTPDPTMNIMINGWLLYQVISCRLWARSAFYQAGGAFGFRDQLQDCLSILQMWPEIAKKQILKHASRQFLEGDVLHWWHEPQVKGTRTRISDDYLWLPYVTSEYIKTAGDLSILDIEIQFVEDDILKEFEDERYCNPIISKESSSLYDHCIRSLEKSLKFGERGLPFIGGGDWNDGMNTVGNRGLGESVWLAWFLSTTLDKFAEVCKMMKDTDRATKYNEISKNIVASIEKNAWDGDWYKRAFFDDGTALGSSANSECKIDSLTQSWAVISGKGDCSRAKKAMNSLENYLVMRDEGLIKLLTPAFGDGDLEPGYIKGYVPGVRENGGQYTHAAAWVIEAFAKIGEGDKALELFDLINPINHTRTNREYSIYKVEPYVMAADVYGEHPHIGRGGWTWYTGSASWIYKSGLESILGFKKKGDTLIIDPCIPNNWKEYSITYKYYETIYNIRFENIEDINIDNISINVDKKSIKGNVIKLNNDKLSHDVDVKIYSKR